VADVFFSAACKPLIERWFSGVFRFAKMALAGSGAKQLRYRYYCKEGAHRIALDTPKDS
jgi:hypothetical protein